MHPTLSDFHASDEERIKHWEKCLVGVWNIPEPPPGWAEIARVRDEQGLTKYPVCATFGEPLDLAHGSGSQHQTFQTVLIND